MDRYFYSIELDDYGNKEIHMCGNIYFNDADETETNYRHAEWTGLFISMEDLKHLIEDDYFYEYVNERVAYLGDMTEQEAIRECNRYFFGLPGTNLHIVSVNEETPCGEYWFDAGEKDVL